MFTRVRKSRGRQTFLLANPASPRSPPYPFQSTVHVGLFPSATPHVIWRDHRNTPQVSCLPPRLFETVMRTTPVPLRAYPDIRNSSAVSKGTVPEEGGVDAARRRQGSMLAFIFRADGALRC